MNRSFEKHPDLGGVRRDPNDNREHLNDLLDNDCPESAKAELVLLSTAIANLNEIKSMLGVIDAPNARQINSIARLSEQVLNHLKDEQLKEQLDKRLKTQLIGFDLFG